VQARQPAELLEALERGRGRERGRQHRQCLTE
jgi:hypothetical protein